MNSIDTITLEVADTQAAANFYKSAFGDDLPLDFRESDDPTSGFRGFTISLVVAQPNTVHALVDAAVAAGATTLKPATKSFWGVGGVVQAPDGTIWKIATSAKKDTGPATRDIDEVVLLLGVDDVKATKRFYVDRGLEVAKSFGGKYAEFASPEGSIKLALYSRKFAAKDAGVPAEGSGSHRVVIGCTAGSFTDPDGFVWAS
ncbi:glyoxalase [Nocardioides sp. HM23]|uniref:glyoxalase n=1 Tax=Nocardioides bizhenqiangii TaxID=3095076 RepID=UPI002ACAC481|nr:glyoxalase [Nocardioides sp. HM23]MDZ5619422.1 glyoxalase [Nocardioides sp. HM23]